MGVQEVLLEGGILRDSNLGKGDSSSRGDGTSTSKSKESKLGEQGDHSGSGFD